MSWYGNNRGFSFNPYDKFWGCNYKYFLKKPMVIGLGVVENLCLICLAKLILLA